MPSWLDILSYAVITGFEFVALCAMTKGGRSWVLRLPALLVLVGVDVLMEFLLRHIQISSELWVAIFFAFEGLIMAALIVYLSQDTLGRRIFLAIAYGVYATSYASIFNLFVYRTGGHLGRHFLGLSFVGGNSIALAIVVILNVVFLVWVLPRMPRDSYNFNWRTPSFVAGTMLVLLFVSGIWPVSIVSAPIQFCVPFALLSVAAWVGFPILCRSMREHIWRITAEHSAELMMAEVKERRAAIDEARRIRHDNRHHRIVLCGLLMEGKTNDALAYLNSLDEDCNNGATAVRAWCDSETVNAILAGYARKAAAKGVTFTAEAHVERVTPLPDAELVAIVANLIENAINGAAKAKDKKVAVTLRQRGDIFGMTVTNLVPQDFQLSPLGLPCEEPGVGLSSVRWLVDKYAGEWLYKVANGALICELVVCAGTKEKKICE